MAKRNANQGIRRPDRQVVAQIFRRERDGRYSFRVHDGRRYVGARQFVGHDLGWPTERAAETAARGCGIKDTVSMVDEWDKRA